MLHPWPALLRDTPSGQKEGDLLKFPVSGNFLLFCIAFLCLLKAPTPSSLLILFGKIVALTRLALSWLIFSVVPMSGVGELCRLPGSAAMKKLHVPMCRHIMDFPTSLLAWDNLFF